MVRSETRLERDWLGFVVGRADARNASRILRLESFRFRDTRVSRAVKALLDGGDEHAVMLAIGLTELEFHDQMMRGPHHKSWTTFEGLEARLIESRAVETAVHVASRRIETADDLASMIDSLAKIHSEALAGSDTTKPLSAVLKECAEEFENPTETGLLFPMPWPELHEATSGGLPLGRIMFVVGKSSEHKTTVALRIAQHSARKHRVVFWTGEDDMHDVGFRFAAERRPARTGDRLNPQGMSGPERSAVIQSIVAEASEDYAQGLQMCDDPAPTFSEFKSRLRMWAAQGVKLVVFDFFQLMCPDDSRTSINDPAWCRRVMVETKRLAREHGISVAFTSQVTKEGDQGAQRELVRDTDPPCGTILRQDAYGTLVIGKVGDEWRLRLGKWKSGEAGRTWVLNVVSQHDEISIARPWTKTVNAGEAAMRRIGARS